MALSNLAVRSLSAVLLAPPVLWAVYAGGLPYQILIGLMLFIMFFEWYNMTLDVERISNFWRFFGVFYIVIPCGALVVLRHYVLPATPCTTPDIACKGGIPIGLDVLIWLLAVVWSTDTGAYLAGRTIGGPKLAPSISPKKTWAGLFGGIAAAGLASWLCVKYTSTLAYLPVAQYAIYIGFAAAIVAQAGDLFESSLKRRFGVKDSGHIIPGHGGVMDRVDGFTFLAPIVAAYLLWFSHSMGYEVVLK